MKSMILADKLNNLSKVLRGNQGTNALKLIFRSESGSPLPSYGQNAYGQPEGSYRQQGSWSYTDGYGNPIKVTFVADENGYQPSSAILPTPVPTEYPTPAVDPTYVEPQSVYQPAYQPAYN